MEKVFTDEIVIESYEELETALRNNITKVNDEIESIEVELCKRRMIEESKFMFDISCEGCLKYGDKSEENLEEDKRKLRSNIGDLNKKLTILTRDIYSAWNIEEKRK